MVVVAARLASCFPLLCLSWFPVVCETVCNGSVQSCSLRCSKDAHEPCVTLHTTKHVLAYFRPEHDVHDDDGDDDDHDDDRDDGGKVKRGKGGKV